MEFGLWEKYYTEILDDFGFSRKNDEESAKLLDEILSTEGCLTLDDLSAIVGFSDKYIVFGAGPSLTLRQINNIYAHITGHEVNVVNK